MEKIALIVPHEQIAANARQVRAKQGLNVQIAVCSSNAISTELAKKYCADGVQVIISRGGMAKAIAREVSVPVVPIEITFMDLMEAVFAAKRMGKRIGVMINAALGYELERVGRILEADLHWLEIPHGGNQIDTIAQAKRDGIEVIVGGTAPVYFAEAAGVGAVPIQSGDEAILDALHQAGRIVEERMRRMLDDRLLRRLLDYAEVGVVLTDTHGEILMSNRSAKQLLGVREPITGQNFAKALPFLPPEKRTDEDGALCRVGERILLLSSRQTFRDGAPFGMIHVVQDARRLENLQLNMNHALYRKGHVAQYTFDNILTQSPKMQGAIEQARLFSQVDSTILITGETGTGKELLAQSIHNASERRKKPFVAINCASIPESILESELFGYEEGAFTGARKSGRKGYFEMAEGGTLFLDEVGEISLRLQSKLLRVLQQKEIVRVGGERVIPVDVRVISATLVDLQKEIADGRFRRDLYYRLNILRISVPPLRERGNDLSLLADRLAGKTAARLGLPVLNVDEQLLARLKSYPWYGNIRELENVIERCTIMSREGGLSPQSLERVLSDIEIPAPHLQAELPQTLEQLERTAICEALARNDGDRAKTCDQLGLSPATLSRRLREWEGAEPPH